MSMVLVVIISRRLLTFMVYFSFNLRHPQVNGNSRTTILVDKQDSAVNEWISVHFNVSQYFLFIYLYLYLLGSFFILLDYGTDDEAKGLLDDSEENGKNNWTKTTITFRDVLWTPGVKTRASVFISVGLLNDNALSF